MSQSFREGLSPLALHETNKALAALENFFELYAQGNDFRNDPHTVEFLKSRLAILRDLMGSPVAQNSSVSVAQRENVSCAVLVDDDVLVRMTWEISAQTKGIKMVAFANPKDFFESLAGQPTTFNFKTPIYIDANLGEGLRGEDFAQQLRKLGFMELYLATGYDSSYFSNVGGLFNGIVGKEPPWSNH